LSWDHYPQAEGKWVFGVFKKKLAEAETEKSRGRVQKNEAGVNWLDWLRKQLVEAHERKKSNEGKFGKVDGRTEKGGRGDLLGNESEEPNVSNPRKLKKRRDQMGVAARKMVRRFPHQLGGDRGLR